MQPSTRIARSLLLLALLSGLYAGLVGPKMLFVSAAPLEAASPGDVVISEFRTRGPAGASDEFIELFNPKGAPISIGGWEIRVLTGTGNEAVRATIPDGFVLDPGRHYLVAISSGGGYSGSFVLSYTTGIVDDGGIAVFDDNGVKIDSVGMNIASIYNENTFLSPLTGSANQSYERKLGGIGGSCIDANDNATDFQLITSDPQILSSLPIYCAGVITFTPTDTPVPTLTFTPTSTATPFSPLSLVINEVGWSGTKYSSSDEWIELYNPSSTQNVSLNGWRLFSDDGNLDITLSGTINAGQYFVIARYSTIFSDVTVDLAYSSSMGAWSSLNNSGTILTLLDPIGAPVDSANADGGSWPAGSASPNYASMERIGPTILPDGPTAWATFADATYVAHDRAAPTPNPVWGTPGHANWTAATVTVTSVPTSSPTRTATITSTPTVTRTATPVTACISSLQVAINEVGWAGTGASSDDEWIELCNPGTTAIDLSGWQLKGNAPDSSPDPVIKLTGTIPPGGYYLLERTDETTVSNITADQIYTGDLVDAGEILILYNSAGDRVDTANIDGGSWPAGSATNQRSMERRSSTLDSPTSWVTFFGTSSYQNGKDAKGNAINGTPKARNWTTIITPTSTAVSPTRVRTATPKPVGRPIINEYLPRPGFDWNQDGAIDVFDEFIEITNVGPVDISISGWKLDDEAGIGSSPFTLPDVTLKPGQHLLFYGSETNILLSDGGDTVRLLNSNGQVWDAHTYSIVKETDKSVCRLPDGYGSWFEDCLPTPNMVNSREGEVPAMPPGNGLQPAICNLPDTLPADFLVAECHGYGANMWRSMYWDEKGWQGDNFVPENTSKWPSFVE